MKLLFSAAFRPLFLLLTLQALAMVALWGLWWTGQLPLAWSRNPALWHAHEMLAGFTGAAIGGFLLTAVANWTSRAQVSGLPLMLLCALWLGGRLSLFAPLASALFDTGYWLLLWLLVANELFRARNARNYKILAVLGLIACTDAGWHLAELRQSALLRQFEWGQLWLVLLLVCVIGGRIIPAFTGNWLRKQAAEQGRTLVPQQLPVAFNRFDLACLVALVAFALCTLLPVAPQLPLATGITAALLHALRLARWQGQCTLRDPLVWMLHLSYAWIPVGLALLALASAGYLPPSAGLHALTIGAIAGMIVSVSARAALGHTNRPLRAHPLLTASIVLLNLAALLRTWAAIDARPALIGLSALAWCAAFLCYGLLHAPMLLAPPAAPQQVS